MASETSINRRHLVLTSGIAPNAGSYISCWYFKNPESVSILEVYFAYKVQA
jgi:hypothetical protein